MNKITLLGRLTRDVEVRYSQTANPVAVAKYGIAVRRQFSKQGEQDVDFFNVVAFGKAAEFVEKFFRKGDMIAIVGRVQVNQYEDKDKVKRISVDVVAEEQHFTGGKGDSKDSSSANRGNEGGHVFGDESDDDLPF